MPFRLMSVLAITVTTPSLDRVSALTGHLALAGVNVNTEKAKATGKTCADFESSYPSGLNLVQLPEIGRQFLLAVPRTRVSSPSGSPLVIIYHGFSDSPWYVSRMGGFPGLLERYGWVGIFPFALNLFGNNGLGGVKACCPEEYDEDCCRNGLHLARKDGNACGWSMNVSRDIKFTEALVDWASDNLCIDRQKVFATGFSSGAIFTNTLGCQAAHLFRAVAPVSGDLLLPDSFCSPSRKISYISFCGSQDEKTSCQDTFALTAEMWSKRVQCKGAGPGNNSVKYKVSATSICTSYDSCEGGNFVEWCKTEGLSHDISGHLRPDDTSYLRPASDLDASEYIFQKFSLLVGESMLFWEHPTDTELEFKASQWPPPTHNDFMSLRRSRALGADPQ